MPDGLQIDVDTSALLRALGQLDVSLVERHTKPACLVTARNIQREARARVKRRTGRTAAGITVQESFDKQGYVVLPFNEALTLALIASGNDQQPENLPYWLEFGTRKMTKKPFFIESARLEETAHDRRIRDAIQDAIDESGLGEA